MRDMRGDVHVVVFRDVVVGAPTQLVTVRSEPPKATRALSLTSECIHQNFLPTTSTPTVGRNLVMPSKPSQEPSVTRMLAARLRVQRDIRKPPRNPKCKRAPTKPEPNRSAAL
jgi:hypothetical protein